MARSKNSSRNSTRSNSDRMEYENNISFLNKKNKKRENNPLRSWQNSWEEGDE